MPAACAAPPGCGRSIAVEPLDISPRLKRLLFAALALSFLPAIAGWLLAGWVFAPNPTPVRALPADLPGETITLSTTDAVNLRAWYLPPAGEPLAGVLLLHCRGCNRGAMLARGRFLLGEGYAVLIPDLRGEGESDAARRGMGVFEVQDVDAALFELRRRLGDKPIAIVGRSKGAAAAVYAHAEVDALVLESLYRDFESAIEHRLVANHGEWAGALTPLVAGPLAFGAKLNRYRANPGGHLGNIKTPVLLMAGDRDELIPWHETQELFAAAAGPKQLWRIAGAGHVDAYDHAPGEWQAQVGPFLRDAFARRASTQTGAANPPPRDLPIGMPADVPADVPADLPIPFNPD